MMLLVFSAGLARVPTSHLPRPFIRLLLFVRLANDCGMACFQEPCSVSLGSRRQDRAIRRQVLLVVLILPRFRLPHGLGSTPLQRIMMLVP